MDSALSPREIQARIRGGASVTDVAEEAGVDVERIEGFAGPVLAEREHMTRTALAATVRRRGDGTGHRKLGDIITERLRARGIDADDVVWDSWRMPDRRWALVGRIEDEDEAASRSAEFLFDPKGRFNVAANADARWMIGEQLPGLETPDNENTVDFQDELALVRATQDTPDVPGDDVPRPDTSYDSDATSELDDLYDMMSGISEDSVRIYVGLDEEGEPVHNAPTAQADEADTKSAPEGSPAGPHEPQGAQVSPAAPDVPADGQTVLEPEQDALVEAPEESLQESPKPKGKRRRAKIPSWDEIMFGGPTKDA
ncbi:DUF3071 domain-containing protein [Tessaracoccus rhinocerotis]|uniref:DUF3071 domain-containing protein n=1 Tax=Tessaracoccus rhinocerotis TaxID=1689449 RepID=A0A553K3R2_9ACTN|nr:septation protein SepH [Tessaracoccus rhinocerotis]TRY19364.1 DUF3071 domain-containing protein [Tessaracoccus rhinocerotis]